MQPLQRSYAITKERISNMLAKTSISDYFNEAKVREWEENEAQLTAKEAKKYDEYLAKKPIYDDMYKILQDNISDKKYLSPQEFISVLDDLFLGSGLNSKEIADIADGLSVMDKQAEIQKDKKAMYYTIRKPRIPSLYLTNRILPITCSVKYYPMCLTLKPFLKKI